MNTTSNRYNVKTGSGTVHSMTHGRGYSMRGDWMVNDRSRVWGKADCGALVSMAATHTDDAVTCSNDKCKGA